MRIREETLYPFFAVESAPMVGEASQQGKGADGWEHGMRAGVC